MKWLAILYSVFELVCLFIWTSILVPLALLVMIVTGSPETSLAMARHLWGPPLRFVARVKLLREPLPDIDFSKPHIYVMNHQSMFDICAAFICIPANIRFVAKESLKYVPFLGWYMWAMGMIFIDRGNHLKAVRSLERAGKRIRDGANILVYPEGTRSTDGRILPFKKGPFVLAIRAGVPIVPVAIDGSGACIPKGTLHFRPGTVRVKLGEPIPTAGLTDADRDALVRRVRDSLIALHESIGGAGGDPKQAIAAFGREGVSEAA
jgi:1-acyl-sn-glycerol-3-phosphate acyltransferase